MSRILAIVFLFSLPISAQAGLMVNISMIYKNGIDKNLVLESELHSIEEVWGKRKIQLTMKNGARLNLRAGFWERPVAQLDQVGPSSKIFLEGELFKPNGELAKQIERRQTQVEIGEPFIIGYKGQSQLLEVTIKPYLE